MKPFHVGSNNPQEDVTKQLATTNGRAEHGHFRPRQKMRASEPEFAREINQRHTRKAQKQRNGVFFQVQTFSIH